MCPSQQSAAADNNNSGVVMSSPPLRRRQQQEHRQEGGGDGEEAFAASAPAPAAVEGQQQAAPSSSSSSEARASTATERSGDDAAAENSPGRTNSGSEEGEEEEPRRRRDDDAAEGTSEDDEVETVAVHRPPPPPAAAAGGYPPYYHHYYPPPPIVAPPHLSQYYAAAATGGAAAAAAGAYGPPPPPHHHPSAPHHHHHDPYGWTAAATAAAAAHRHHHRTDSYNRYKQQVRLHQHAKKKQLQQREQEEKRAQQQQSAAAVDAAAEATKQFVSALAKARPTPPPYRQQQEQPPAAPPKPQPTARPSSSSSGYVTLRSRDIPHGMGAASYQKKKDDLAYTWKGREIFYGCCNEYRDSYRLAKDQDERAAVVRRVLDEIDEAGGRFVRCVVEWGRYMPEYPHIAFNKVVEQLRAAGKNPHYHRSWRTYAKGKPQESKLERSGTGREVAGDDVGGDNTSGSINKKDDSNAKQPTEQRTRPPSDEENAANNNANSSSSNNSTAPRPSAQRATTPTKKRSAIPWLGFYKPGQSRKKGDSNRSLSDVAEQHQKLLELVGVTDPVKEKSEEYEPMPDYEKRNQADSVEFTTVEDELLCLAFVAASEQAAPPDSKFDQALTFHYDYLIQEQEDYDRLSGRSGYPERHPITLKNRLQHNIFLAVFRFIQIESASDPKGATARSFYEACNDRYKEKYACECAADGFDQYRRCKAYLNKNPVFIWLMRKFLRSAAATPPWTKKRSRTDAGVTDSDVVAAATYVRAGSGTPSPPPTPVPPPPKTIPTSTVRKAARGLRALSEAPAEPSRLQTNTTRFLFNIPTSCSFDSANNPTSDEETNVALSLIGMSTDEPIQHYEYRMDMGDDGPLLKKRRRSSASSSIQKKKTGKQGRKHQQQRFLPSEEELQAAKHHAEKGSITKFYQRLGDMAKFKQIHGHCNVRTDNEDDAALAYWASRQRSQKRKFDEGRESTMTEAKIRALDSIGFPWKKSKKNPSGSKTAVDPVEFNEDSNATGSLESGADDVDLLRDEIHETENANNKAASAASGASLGRKGERKRTSNSSRRTPASYAQLHHDNTMFPGEISRIEKWNKRYVEMVDFYNKHGHSNVPYDGDENPGKLWERLSSLYLWYPI